MARFQEVYIHERQLAIDESQEHLVSRLSPSQNPPVAVLNSKIYTGKENDEVQNDLGRKAFMSVLQPYLDKGFYTFMDNYYTSVAV